MIKKSLCVIALFLASGLAAFSQETEEKPVSVSLEPEVVRAGDDAVIKAVFTIPEGMYMARVEKFFFVEASGDIPGLVQAPLPYPQGTEKHGMTVYKNSVLLERTISLPGEIAPGVYTVTVTAGYQYCNEKGVCYMPKTESFSFALEVKAFGSASGASVSTTAAAPVEEGGHGRQSILLFLLLALLGGILLNVMPCVLPLLSVKALNLVQASGQNGRRIFIGSLFYGLGILVSLLVLAGVVAAIKASGELAGWGFQFQNPVFVLVLASAVFLFSLSMFGVFTLTAPGGGLAAKAGTRGGYTGAFFSGVFAVLVATPCTAPFLGTALGFAFSQPAGIIFLIFGMIGIGFALPFILLGAWPKLIRKLPKPGEWMNIFKEGMGFLLLATVLYLLLTLYHQVGGEGILRVLAFFGILSVAAWGYGRFAGPGSPVLRQWITIVLSLGLITAGALTVIQFDKTAAGPDPGKPVPGKEAASAYTREDGWEIFSEEKVEAALAQGRPVFINFWASWCTTCKVNKPVLNAGDVKAAFAKAGVLKLEADFTENDPLIARWIQRLGRGGVPVYALFKPGTEEPILLPELLSRKIVLRALREAVPDQP